MQEAKGQFMYSARLRRLERKRAWYRAICAVFTGLFIAGLFFLQRGQSAPLLANYYLGTLPTDTASVSLLAKNDLLILSPEQAVVRKNVIDSIKKINPDVILLAYVPSQSYSADWENYPASAVYSKFHVADDWWLRDPNGNVISNWPGHRHANLNQGWSDYLIGYVKDNILSQGIWDGIFWDMVYDNISWINGGNIDLDGNGVKDAPSEADKTWVDRTVYLLSQSRARLPVKYIMINGSSVPAFQTHVNGRMYESYPTSWEAGGNWGGIMNGFVRVSSANRVPRIYVFNSNTDNTGKKNDYRKMRFGLTSSLLLDDVYFSFDYGTEDHNQIWWYDEYDINLGAPLGEADSLTAKESFQNDVWRRDYERGLALVNATWEGQEVDLGGEYEKLIGTQDPNVNDGAITDRVRLGARDGLVMLKTYQTAQGVVFGNGNFLRFYDWDGKRVRNGFFAFEDGIEGGAQIYNGDIDGMAATAEKIVVDSKRLRVANSTGQNWYDDAPLGPMLKGKIKLTVGKLSETNKETAMVLTSSDDGAVGLYTYYGAEMKTGFYPLGAKYGGGFDAAIGNVDGGAYDEIILAAGAVRGGEILVYDASLKKIKSRFYPFGKNYRGGVAIAAGDVGGDGRAEIVAIQAEGSKSVVRVFDGAGKKLREFTVPASFGGTGYSVGVADVNFDGQGDIVVGSGE